jgi:hypothetical protein
MKSSVFWGYKAKGTYSIKMTVDFQRTTRCFIPEDRTVHNHNFENLRSYKIIISLLCMKVQSGAIYFCVCMTTLYHVYLETVFLKSLPCISEWVRFRVYCKKKFTFQRNIMCSRIYWILSVTGSLPSSMSLVFPRLRVLLEDLLMASLLFS